MKIIGVGAGQDQLTIEAISAIESAPVVYGSRRALELAKEHLKSEYHEISDYSRLDNLPQDAVLLSTGDPMFSGLGKIARKGDLIIPGISSLQIACARLGINEEELRIVNFHGRRVEEAKKNLLAEMKRKGTVFILPDPTYGVDEIAGFLQENGYNSKIALLERLAYPDENIEIGTIEDPPRAKLNLYCLVVGPKVIVSGKDI